MIYLCVEYKKAEHVEIESRMVVTWGRAWGN